MKPDRWCSRLVLPTPVPCTCDYKKLPFDYLKQSGVSGIPGRNVPTWRFRLLPPSPDSSPHGPARRPAARSPARQPAFRQSPGPGLPARCSGATGATPATSDRPTAVRWNPRNGAPNAADDRRGRPPSLLLLADCLAVLARYASHVWPGTVAGPAHRGVSRTSGTTPSAAAGCLRAARGPPSPGTAGGRPGYEWT